MARNHPTRSIETKSDIADEQPPERGGTPGVVIPEGTKRLSPTAVVSASVIGSAKRQEANDVPPAKQYTVVGGPADGHGNIMVMYDRVKVPLRRGKVVSAASVDIELLVRQGVILQEIVPPAPAPEPAIEVATEPSAEA